MKSSETSSSTEIALFKTLWTYVKQDTRNLKLTILFLALNTVVTLSAPIFFQRALSLIENISNSNLLQPLIIALAFYFILSLLNWFSSSTIMVASTNLNSNVIRSMRIDTFSSLLRNNISFYDNNESGNLVSTLSNDLNELYSTGMAIAEVATSLLKLIGILLVLVVFSPILTLTAVIMLPIFFAIAMIIRKYRRKAESNWRKNFGKVNHSFAETMRSLAVSKAFNREADNIVQFTELNEATFQASIKRGAAIFITRPIADLLRNLLLILILAVGTWQVQTNGLSIASFYLFIFLLEYYYEPIRSISQNYNYFQTLFANLERILGIAYNESRYEQNLGSKILEDGSIDVEFKNVNFAYNPNYQVLQDISFKINSGKRLALVGHTGAGKTTIASLLMRFYEVSSGNILINQIPIDQYELTTLRRSIGLVSQRILLFKGTIRDNLLIANRNASDEEIWQAIDAVQAREFIELLPGRLDFQIDHQGQNLSTGQRQMITYARTLLAKPKLIILDEATSAVDLYTESKIQEATDLMLQGTTSIVIAHRLTTIIRSDIIVVLENGEISQIGDHQSLLEEDGPYQEMYDLYLNTQSAKYLEKIKQ